MPYIAKIINLIVVMNPARCSSGRNPRSFFSISSNTSLTVLFSITFSLVFSSVFTLHYLIITTKRDFGHFYIEFTTDEPDVFNENVASLMPLIMGEMFGLRESLKSTDFEADTLLLTGVDSTLSRLCYEKKLKVNKAVTKLFSMSITEGFRLELDEKDVEDFIEKYSLLNIAQEIDVKALV